MLIDKNIEPFEEVTKFIGSHNSWSFNPIKQLWLKPFFWVAKCQRVTILDQYFNYGVRVFDLRLRYDKRTKKFEAAHGLAIFKCDWENDLKDLNALAALDTIYCRVLLEDDKDQEDQEENDYRFEAMCQYLVGKYPKIKFFGGFPARHRWRQYIYHFDTKEPTLFDAYSSSKLVNGNKIWPWLYAFNHNRENMKRDINEDYLFIDYVDIK